METRRVEREEAFSGSSPQQCVAVPLISASPSSSTNTSKAKSMLLQTSVTKDNGRRSHDVGRSSSLSRASSDWFWWEIVAAISSIVVIVARVAVLYVYSDRATPSWPYGITVSTLLKPGCCASLNRETTAECARLSPCDCSEEYAAAGSRRKHQSVQMALLSRQWAESTYRSANVRFC
jgi:hypothetical protein